MLRVVLSVTCYLPNSTYSYNPLSRQGTLIATFIPADDSTAYQVCESLDGHLVQAKIVLIDDSASNENNDVASRYATSENYYFAVGANISVVVVARSDRAHQRALQTRQTNFIIELLDMDAVVEQTISLYAIETYNHDECFKNVKFYMYDQQMQLEASMLDCDLNLTVFGAQINKDAINDSTAQAIITVTGVGSMQIDVGAALQLAYGAAEKLLSVTFNCRQISEVDPARGAMCTKIYNYLMQYPNYECEFECRAQALSRNLFVQMQTYVAAISMREMDGCMSSSYLINEDFIVASFSILQESRCQPLHSSYAISILGNLQQYEQTYAGLNFMFSEPYDETSNLMKVSMECSRQADPTLCRTQLKAFSNMDSNILRLRLYYQYSNTDYDFMSALSERDDYCFDGVEAELYIDSYSASTGGVRIHTNWTANENCQYNVEVRMLLQCVFVLLTEAGGRIDLTESEPLFVLSQREVYSAANKTLAFTCNDCRTELKQISTAIRNKQLYAYMAIESEQIPINVFSDKITDTNPYIFLGIGCFIGLLCGLGGFAINFWTSCKCKKKFMVVIQSS